MRQLNIATMAYGDKLFILGLGPTISLPKERDNILLCEEKIQARLVPALACWHEAEEWDY